MRDDALAEELLLALLVPSDDFPTLDPVRIQKGMFYVCAKAMGEDHEPDWPLEFLKYNYGPCSFELYRLLDRLVSAGYAERSPVPYGTWSRYTLTEAGLARLAAAGGDSAQLREFAGRVRAWVASMSFTDLLRAIYAQFPAWAENTVAPELREQP